MQKATLLAGLKANPGDSVFLESLGSILEADQEWNELLGLFREQLPFIRTGSTNEAYVLYMLGKAAVELGRMDEALPWLERSVELHRDFPYSHHLLGRCYRHVRRFDEALEAFDRCTELAPEFPWSLLEAGEISLERGEPGHSLKYLREGLSRQRQQDPSNTEVYDAVIARAEDAHARKQRNKLAAELWPDRPPIPESQEMEPLDQFRLSLYRFSKILDRLEASHHVGRGTDLST